jgi:DNA invertase Pin-like site-specific DNA recombinase
MKPVFAYIRVSTQRQKTEGSSPEEQRFAIEAYAKRNNLSIVEWFEETKTAAKRGRPTFSQMMRSIGKGGVSGIVIHKIDRGARNLRDWASLGELVDRGVEVHLAHESLDMRSRGGRLAADIQAVVAADFIRNLRDETRKGMYGRLKQGLYPFAAPVGYLNKGKGKAKEIDPVQGPLVRHAFELYASGEFNFELLLAEMHRFGLRGKRGTALSKNGLTTLLNNPFYIGLIHLKKTDEIFEGAHPPLIAKSLYDRVQAVLRDNRQAGLKYKHDFLFRRLIRCATCKHRLIGEIKKGRYIYYRCHDRACGGVCLSERTVEEHVEELFARLTLEPDEVMDLREIVDFLREGQADERMKRAAALKLHIAQCDERLNRLTDALLDGTLDKPLFENRKTVILGEKRSYIDQLENLDTLPSKAECIMRNLELANTAYLQYKFGFPSEKRDLIAEATSNFFGEGRNPVIALKSPFAELAEWRISTCGSPTHDNRRMRVKKIWEIFMQAADIEIGIIQRPQSPDVHTLAMEGPECGQFKLRSGHAI